MDDRQESEFIWAELVKPNESRPASEPFGVPRRFGIGTILIVTAAYGVMLAILRLARWDPAAIFWALGFISAIGLGQMLLFNAKRPREASIITGAIALPLAILGTVLTYDTHPYNPMESFCGLICAVPFGAAAGYLAGGVVAGVFLVMDAVEQALGRVFPPSDLPNGDDSSEKKREKKRGQSYFN